MSSDARIKLRIDVQCVWITREIFDNLRDLSTRLGVTLSVKYGLVGKVVEIGPYSEFADVVK